MKKILIGIAVVAFLGSIYLFTTYNSLVSSNESVDAQWAQVETQYQRRFDLIPNIVQSVKGFAKQEQTVFADIAEARTRYSGATSVGDKVHNANQVESALSRLLVVAESYPDLKSSQLFTQLNVELEGTENRISVERKRFNDLIQSYNLRIKRAPSSWVAGYFGFEEREYFESAKGSEIAPQVNF
jgi:LemA protein